MHLIAFPIYHDPILVFSNIYFCRILFTPSINSNWGLYITSICRCHWLIEYGIIIIHLIQKYVYVLWNQCNFYINHDLYHWLFFFFISHWLFWWKEFNWSVYLLIIYLINSLYSTEYNEFFNQNLLNVILLPRQLYRVSKVKNCWKVDKI